MFRKMHSSLARPSVLAASLATGMLFTGFAGPGITRLGRPETKTACLSDPRWRAGRALPDVQRRR